MTSSTPMRRATLRTTFLIGVSVGSLMIAGSGAAQDRVFGSRGGTADPAAAAARAAQDQASRSAETNSATRRAIETFQRAAATRSAMSEAQKAARAAAQAAQSNIRNGLGQGGLQVASGVVFGPDGKPVDGSLWVGANGPTQSVGDNGRTNVTVGQTQTKAILTWDSFNVGRETDLRFNQSGADAVVLNRVTDASADPSRILGSISAPGTVLVLNRNGVIFGGASQVNVRNLVAAAANISDTQFLNSGIYSSQDFGSYLPSFTNAGGKVTVEAGAQITTATPTSVTSGGGYVLLLGQEVTNAGTITTPKGQALLSAGDDFIVRKGYGTDANPYSTTRGNEVHGLINADSASGTVTNSGLIEATQGDITLGGRTIRQDGVAVATTSVNQRGTIHLLNSASDGQGSVTLGTDSLTIILPELDSKDTALDSQRDALIKQSDEANINRYTTITDGFDDRSTLADRLDQSRIEIVTGGNVLFAGGSQTSAQGGQVAVQAAGASTEEGVVSGRITVADGALIDVSGVQGVALDMASNSIKVNVQGNELRDSPLNRDTDYLRNNDVWLDIRDLVLVPAGTDGYASDRWYTKGGLLEVSGYIGNTAHSIGEWASVGGTITLAGKEVVADKGATFDISGGSLDYQGGYIRSTRVLGSDGKLYDLASAPAWLKYVGYGNTFTRAHDRWGEQYTEIYSTPLFSARDGARWQDGYTVGRDAGQLILSAPTVLFEADIAAGTIDGEHQTARRADGVTDGYKLGQTTVAQGGTLALVGAWDVDSHSFGGPYDTNVSFGAFEPVTGDLAPSAAIAEDRIGTAWFDSTHLNTQALGALKINTIGSLGVEKALTVNPGGVIELTGKDVIIGADLTARSGAISVTGSDGVGVGTLIVGEGVTLDARGLWTNQLLDSASLSRLAYIDGGNVTLTAGGDLTLSTGSLIDTSAGAAYLADGRAKGGTGGDITLSSSNAGPSSSTGGSGSLTLNGELRGYGFGEGGGGTLTLRTGDVVVIEDANYDLGSTLEAGEILPTDVVLAEGVVWPAGQPLPTTVVSVVENRIPEGVISEDTRIEVGPPFGGVQLPVTADIVVAPDGIIDLYGGISYYYKAADGSYRSFLTFVGGTIPAGSTLMSPAIFLAGKVTIANGGLSLGSVSTTYAAGSVAPMDVTIAAGTVLRQNSKLAVPVTFEPLNYLHLTSSDLSGGFSKYVIGGDAGLVVGADAAVQPAQTVLRFTEASRGVGSNGDPYAALEYYTGPVYAEDPTSAKLTQRPGVDLVLRAGLYDATNDILAGGWLSVEKGASLEVDPGHAITLASGGQITVDGSLTAPGGSIEVLNRSVAGGLADDPLTLSVWIGDRAVLDASARAYVATDALGRRYGVAPDGGNIVLGSAEAGGRAAVVVRSGAVLDASGTSAQISKVADGTLTSGSTVIDAPSNGGSITIGSSNGIYLDGTLRAAAGGEGAEGGSLSVLLPAASSLTLNGASIPARLSTARSFVITQAKEGSGLSENLRAGEADTVLSTIQANLSVKQIQEGGFDTLVLAGGNGFFFDGDVDLSVERSITLRGAGLYDTRADGDVRLKTAYLFLDGAVTPIVSGTVANAVAPSGYELGANFTAIADMIDVRNGDISISGLGDVANLNFEQSTLQSSGDIRFLASTDTPKSGYPTTRLSAAGDLDLIARQLYPATDAYVEVTAGPMTGTNDNTLRIASVDGSVPKLPYSVFGSISFNAGTIDQGGVVRAPLGNITLGSAQTQNLTLSSGSITSVSADGLAILYGGTGDDVKWTVNGNKPTSVDVVNGTFSWSINRDESQGIVLKAQNVVGAEGSMLDLSGGGELLGAAFLTGRGGSVDALLSPSKAGNQLYAIIPGKTTTALADSYYAKWTGNVPAVGEQIAVGDGVTGLAAGTYTLLPAYYALLPGAYLVELGTNSPTVSSATIAVPNGSYITGVTRSVANTSISDALLTQATITSGEVVRTRSSYNETGYDRYLVAQAAITGALRPGIAADGKWLTLSLQNLSADAEATSEAALVFDGVAKFGAAEGEDGKKVGYDGALLLRTYNSKSAQEIHITGADSTTQRTSSVLPVSADALNAFNAPAIYIGPRWERSQTSDVVLGWGGNTGWDGAPSIVLESGAVLKAAQVTVGNYGSLILESGSGIDTRGYDAHLIDSSAGFLFGTGTGNLLIVSNGDIDLSPNLNTLNSDILIRVGAFLYGEGTVGFSSPKGVTFEGAPLLAARNLNLAASSINIGTKDELAAAETTGLLPGGLSLDQDLLETLAASGVEKLTLGASQSLNFFGSVDLNLSGTAQKPLLDQLVLNTPAIYGLGTEDDSARLTVDRLVWNGNYKVSVANGKVTYSGALPGAVVQNGAGTGSGALELSAREIVLGYPDKSQINGKIDFNRLVLGFSGVTLSASERIISNNQGNLAVYQSGPSPDASYDAERYAGVGGNLNLVTPLLTGKAGSTITYRAGGSLSLTAPEGATDSTGNAELGAIINLVAADLNLDTAIALHSGRLTLTSTNDITLGDKAAIDLSGLSVGFYDVSKSTWGGDLVAESTSGNILFAEGSSVDVSANGADGGSLILAAADAHAGGVLLAGRLKGSSGAGLAGGSIDIRAQTIGRSAADLTSDFAALNDKLNAGGFTEARSFTIKQGDLAVGDLTAHNVTLSIDGGSLTVNGTIDASGATPGSILLAARDDLTISGSGKLDVHGTELQVDSYGDAIEARNRGKIELTSSEGWLRLQSGATLDLSSPDGIDRGKVALNVGRTSETSGDARIDAAGPLTIKGAAEIALNAFWSYSPTDEAGTIVQDNGGTAPVGADGSVGLNQIDTRNVQFINAALTNTGLANRTAGLSAYNAVYHLRPGVEITSADTASGNLTVSGDIDLSGYRYGNDADRDTASATYGGGDPLALVIRAAGNLTINGSISDGFGPKAEIAPIYTGLIPDVSNDPRFELTEVWWLGGLAYVSNGFYDAVYLLEDWKIPDTPFYSAVGYSNAETGQSYYSGDTIPAGTRLEAAYGALIFEPGDNALPVLAEGRTRPLPALPATSSAAAMLATGNQSAAITLVSGADLGAADARTLQAATNLRGKGNLLLSNAYTDSVTGSAGVSVIRTGTGNLDLLAGGDLTVASLYGVYTAGTNTTLASNNAAYAGLGYYPDHGGDLTVTVQGDLRGYIDSTINTSSSDVGNWLWRQAGASDSDTPTAWAINFGSYVTSDGAITIKAFSGFGALGGGNVDVAVGNDASSVDVAAGSTGRVTSVDTNENGKGIGGTLVQTGGGDLSISVGGRLNADGGSGGVVTDARGDVSVEAASIGVISPLYGFASTYDTRAIDPYAATLISSATGGLRLVNGDGGNKVRTLGDLVLEGVGNAGQVSQLNGRPGGVYSLWQNDTSVDLISAGGNLVPIQATQGKNVSSNGYILFYLPPILRAAAASGSIYYGGFDSQTVSKFVLTPSPHGQLELLAGNSIYGDATIYNGYPAPTSLASARWEVSGAAADRAALSNPFNPGSDGFSYDYHEQQDGSLHADDNEPIRIYAVKGDLVSVLLGSAYDYPEGLQVNGAAKAAWIRAGGDIVGFGQSVEYQRQTPSVIVNVRDTDVSLIEAGGNIYNLNVDIAGPGTLEVTAGGNIYQGNAGSITSIGPIVEGDTRPGASIAVMAGMANGVDWGAIRTAYLDPANLADLTDGRPLDDPLNKGKVAKVYTKELADWLKGRYDFSGTNDEALAYFDALAPEQQRIFLRDVYYAELREGGREYNNADSARRGSYLRGRQMVATLFPEKDAAGKDIVRTGSYTAFGGSGLRTLYGGDVDVLAPGGQIIVGVTGEVPPASSGIITQGQGDISLYSKGSILLGLSRIMTTFGGSILGWSADGDINAGRGSKTTLVYTPPLRTYDGYGNVTLSPQTPSSGAGIATLAPIPEVPAGDIDLIAPLGTIDAGEAGIRVSGNINLAALQVLNAANIQVKGNAAGIPQVAVVNVGALAAASSAASAVTAEATRVAERARPQMRTDVPAIVNVRFVGFGDN